jgi:2-amino-4-hydroxy-6-hydroxymethyldihydropteridine diphosphokinase
MAKVFVALGSNQGDRKKFLRQAMRSLCDFGTEHTFSHVYRTKPYGGVPQPDFLNMVVRFETAMTPSTFLENLLSLEQSLGRKRLVRWGPRTIDLDILFYGDEIIETEHLVIPHPDLHNRWFVLRPLLDIEPEYVHPRLKKTIRELYDELMRSSHPAQEKES